MPAYLIAHRREISDPETLKKYNHVESTVEKFGGKVVLRSDSFEVLEGKWNSGRHMDDSRPERLTIIEFPDMGKLRGWYDSDDYASLKSIRQHASASDVIAADGDFIAGAQRP